MADVIRVFMDEASLRQVREALASLENQARLVLRDAALDGAEILRKEISDRAPRATGEGAANIITEVWASSVNKIEIAVGPDRDRFYLLFQEYGADEHQITPNAKKALAFEDVIVGKVTHPGVRSRPFMRPALDARARDVTDKIGNTLKVKLGL